MPFNNSFSLAETCDKAVWPDFYIVGAPKSGTTSIRKYLSDNHNIYMPSPEEPNFFCSDLNSNLQTKGIEWYLRKYYNINCSEYDKVGEKSTWYLYSKVAVKNILAFNPNAKIIVMLRNPIQLAYAFHQEMVFCKMETVLDFETAWMRQFNKHRRRNTKTRGFENLFQYGQVASLGTQIERLILQMRPRHLFIGFLDDLNKHPRILLCEICRFLSLPYRQDCEIPKENRSKRIKCECLDRLFIPPKILTQGSEVLKKFTGLKSLYVGRLMRQLRLKFNTANQIREPLNGNFFNKLVQYFEPEIRKLESITGRDLSHYRSP
jgi:hypothetical protein